MLLVGDMFEVREGLFCAVRRTKENLTHVGFRSKRRISVLARGVFLGRGGDVGWGGYAIYIRRLFRIYS